jgi:hypothetical protein
VWFLWRSARDIVELYITATQAIRLGGGLPPAYALINNADTAGYLLPIQELINPIGQHKNLRLWLGASLLHAGVLPPTATALKDKDLNALVAVELHERSIDSANWKITSLQQADRSILWCCSMQSFFTEIEQLLLVQKLKITSVAPLWSVANSKSISLEPEALLWWLESSALTGIHFKHGIVQNIVISNLKNSTLQNAQERLGVQLGLSEQTKELVVCIGSTLSTNAIQDASMTLLPQQWHALQHLENSLHTSQEI